MSKQMVDTSKLLAKIAGGLSAEDAIKAILAEREQSDKIDVEKLSAFVISFTREAIQPASDNLFKALAAIGARVKDAESEQVAIKRALWDAVAKEFGEDATKKLRVVGMAIVGTAENGNKTQYSRLGVDVVKRAAIVHDSNFVRAIGYRPLAGLTLNERDAAIQAKFIAAYEKDGPLSNKRIGELDGTGRLHYKLAGPNADYAGQFERVLPVSEKVKAEGAKIAGRANAEQSPSAMIA